MTAIEVARLLTHGVEFSSAQQVEMKVFHGLPRTFTAIGDNAKTVFNPDGFCKLWDCFKDFGHCRTVRSVHFGGRGDVLPRDYEDVHGSKGRDVVEGHAELVAVKQF